MARRKTAGKAVKNAGAKPANTARSQPQGSATTPAKPGPPAGSVGFRAKIRMYRQGLGDCFLITLPREGNKPYYIVIDCGVIIGTPDAGTIMTKVVQNIADTTDGHINLLVATHEHWDHLSGMIQARDLWEKLTVDEVWLAWTENPDDELAQRLGNERQALRAALATAANRMRMAGSPEAADEVAGLLEFFGAARGETTTDALNVVKGLTQNIRCRLPTADPVTLEGTGVKVYVLGPPHDEKLIKKMNPSTRKPETYGIEAMNAFLSGVAPALADPEPNAPFDRTFQIPLDAAKQMPFFEACYWGEDADSTEKDQGWRRIDGSWLDSSSSLALQLDNATNNTSLVLAFEFDGGDVLLFAADAQVGNWLSWQNLSWEVDGKAVTGPDLLRRTIFYKVGHHGSHNATLREQGLEEMTSLKSAFVPVDHDMALKKHWDRMPLPQLLDRLDEITNRCVLRIDNEVPPPLKDRVDATELFYEMQL